MKHFAFVLSMPSVNTHDGKWTGSGTYYAATREFPNESKLLNNFGEGVYLYNFGDGWVARVDVEKVTSREKYNIKRKSKGFFGYDWMVDSIIQNGKIIPEEELS